MLDIDKIDSELYVSVHGIPKIGNFDEIWAKIKNSPQVLKESIQITKDKFGQKDIVKGLTICKFILINYNTIDYDVYEKLINSIYTNIDIARIVIGGASNGGNSFLLLSLQNHGLRLLKEQKDFAVNEAMNKVGTTKYSKLEEDYYKKLEENGITDDITATIDIDGHINPIGEQTKAKYINSIFASIINTQAHGKGSFDIRYHILRNPNWTLDEKNKLIMDFWSNDEDYEECLNEWEWDVANNVANYENSNHPSFDKDELLNDYTYEMLLNTIKDKDIANEIWQEIQFCKQMRKLRSVS